MYQATEFAIGRWAVELIIDLYEMMRQWSHAQLSIYTD